MTHGVRRRVLVLAALAASAADCAQASEADKERSEPPRPDPVIADGVRYEAPPFMRAQGFVHNGGYVQAIDTATGERRWVVDVLGPPARDGKEDDKTDVFIATIALSAGGNALLVTDERGRRFSLDLASRVVTRDPLP